MSSARTQRCGGTECAGPTIYPGFVASQCPLPFWSDNYIQRSVCRANM